jgi:hypothetical protein
MRCTRAQVYNCTCTKIGDVRLFWPRKDDMWDTRSSQATHRDTQGRERVPCTSSTVCANNSQKNCDHLQKNKKYQEQNKNKTRACMHVCLCVDFGDGKVGWWVGRWVRGGRGGCCVGTVQMGAESAAKRPRSDHASCDTPLTPTCK